MAGRAGSVCSFRDAMICLFVIDGGAGLRKDFGVTGFALIFYTLVVLAVREGHVAVLGLKQDRFGRHAGRELFNNDLIIVGRWRWDGG
jgi:hypothetical protein